MTWPVNMFYFRDLKILKNDLVYTKIKMILVTNYQTSCGQLDTGCFFFQDHNNLFFRFFES